MQVHALAKSSGLTTDTVRHYTRIGLLNPVKNPSNGYKEYNLEDLKRLLFIVRARDLGFSLKDIQQIFQKADDGDSPCPMVRNIIEERLKEVKRKMDEMMSLYARMNAAVKEWEKIPDQPCGRHLCHLIEGMHVESAQKGEEANHE